jgi:cell division protease FtsH
MKQRLDFRYLEVLNKNDELNLEIQRLQKEIASLRQSVNDSAIWFLQISGLTLPKNGYVVVDQLFNTPQLDNSITIRQVDESNVVSLAEMQKRIASLTSIDQLDAYRADLIKLVQEYRSSVLGIGDEPMKEQLRDLEVSLAGMQSPDTKVTAEQQLAVFKDTIITIRKISSDLNSLQNNVRLSQLRSVRNYKALLDQYTVICEDSGVKIPLNWIRQDKVLPV